MSSFRVNAGAVARCLLVLTAATCAVHAASPSDIEDFHVEVTGSAWILHTAGQIQSGALPVDLRGDLNVEQNKPTFFGKLVVKPGRKHRIIVEGTPYNLDGRKNLTETIVYRGQTFNVNETVVSNASLTYVFAGYQYDVLSREAGHLGIQVGGSYLDATGTISGLTSAISATKSQRIGLPLVGTEFRFAPIPGLRAIQIAGEVKGMGLGDYGHYIQSELKAGLRAGLFTFEAGYRFVDANVHETGSNPSGVSPQFKGPIAGVVFRY